ncbi:MAG: pyridoxal-dependent decarboxylase [Gemmatimonadota bacterium]
MTDTHTSFDLTDQEFRSLGQAVIDLMLGATQAERTEPVFRSISGPESRALLDEPLPAAGTRMDEVLRLWSERVLPWCRRNGHPRFFAYVCTSADPYGMLADAMASALNQPVTAWRSTPAAAEVERLAVRWLDELVGFAGGGSGLLVSGGSMANLHGLACAVARSELEHPGVARERLTAYLSPEGHVSMKKALRLMGIPAANVRMLAMDARRRMRPEALKQALEEDRAQGLLPTVVCASSGTANTGAIDPLLEIASVCAPQGVWLHIDGAYGAPAAMTDGYAWLREAFARADSLSLDPHKWLFAPVDAGCILVRDPQALTRAFAEFSEYTEVSQTEEIERFAFFDQGVEMSRRFRGLKVWTILKARGWHRLRDAVAHDIALREYLDERIDAEPELQPLGSELSISCFRFLPPSEKSSDDVNRHIAETLVREGRCYLSPTRLDGVFALRACIVNFRTTRADIDLLLDEILRIGRAALG